MDYTKMSFEKALFEDREAVAKANAIAQARLLMASSYAHMLNLSVNSLRHHGVSHYDSKTWADLEAAMEYISKLKIEAQADEVVTMLRHVEKDILALVRRKQMKPLT